MSIRIIIKRSFQPRSNSGFVDTTWHTFLIEAPEVEKFFRGGGMNEDSFDLREFAGASAEVSSHDSEARP